MILIPDYKDIKELTNKELAEWVRAQKKDGKR